MNMSDINAESHVMIPAVEDTGLSAVWLPAAFLTGQKLLNFKSHEWSLVMMT